MKKSIDFLFRNLLKNDLLFFSPICDLIEIIYMTLHLARSVDQSTELSRIYNIIDDVKLSLTSAGWRNKALDEPENET